MKKTIESLINFFFQPCKNKQSVLSPTLEDYLVYYGLIIIMLVIVIFISHFAV